MSGKCPFEEEDKKLLAFHLRDNTKFDGKHYTISSINRRSSIRHDTAIYMETVIMGDSSKFLWMGESSASDEKEHNRVLRDFTLGGFSALENV